jgi:hypothetical protein
VGVRGNGREGGGGREKEGKESGRGGGEWVGGKDGGWESGNGREKGMLFNIYK